VVRTVVHAGLLLALTRGKPHYVLVAGLITLGQVTATLTLEYAYALLQGQLRYTPFNTLRVVQPSLYTLILGVAVVLGVGTLQGVAAVTVGATFVSAALTAWIARPRTSVEPRQDDLELRDVVKFGTQGYLGYVSPIEAFRLDQLVVGLGLSPAALGYYVVGAAFTNLPRTLAHSIGLIAAPHIASQTEIGDRRRTVVRFGALSAVLLATIVIALIVAVGLLLPFLFGHRYSSAVPIARLLLAGSFFLAMKRVLTDALRGAGEASAGAKAEIVTVVTFGVAAAALAPRFGAEGVAAAFGLATAAGCAALLRLLRRTPLFQEAGAPA
jgi:O-antigen/teichoic acid export membrane protein